MTKRQEVMRLLLRRMQLLLRKQIADPELEKKVLMNKCVVVLKRMRTSTILQKNVSTG